MSPRSKWHEDDQRTIKLLRRTLRPLLEHPLRSVGRTAEQCLFCGHVEHGLVFPFGEDDHDDGCPTYSKDDLLGKNDPPSYADTR